MSEYGLDYAMHRHDIERLEKVPFYGRGPDHNPKHNELAYINMVNYRLAEGWKVLGLGTDADSEPFAFMGVPRPKECGGLPKHDGLKVYSLRDDKWHCPKCLAEWETRNTPEAF